MTLQLILQFSFIILAAICKALTDTIAFHRGGVFKGRKFFDIYAQGEFLPFTKYPLDGFHVTNSLMIVFFVAAVCIPPSLEWYLNIILLGTAFNLVFDLFWKYIFN
jgi:hypothetical protein